MLNNPKINLFPYDGAFDATKHPALISANDVVNADNIIYTTYSTKRLRPGASFMFSESRPAGNRPIISSVDFWRLGSQRIVHYNGKELRATDRYGNTTDLTPTDMPTDANVTFTVFSGAVIIFFDDANFKPHYWTMSGGLVKITDAPAGASFGRVWLNSLWVPDPAIPGRIKKSKTGDFTDFSTGDSQDFDLDTNDGDPDGITAIFPPSQGTSIEYGNMYVSKRLSIFKIGVILDSSSGDFYFTYLKISDGIGCISHSGVCAVEDYIFFPSDRGIHYIASSQRVSGIETSFLTKEVQPLWAEQVGFNRSKFMRGVYDPSINCYLLAYPDLGRNYPNSIWGYSLYAGKWFRWVDFNHSCLFRFIDFETKKIRIGLGGQTGDFGYLDTTKTTDYGKKYNCFVESGIIYPTGNARDAFKLEQMTPVFVPQISGSFNIRYKIDGKVIETIEFEMISNDEAENLGEDFIVGVTPLGGIPQIMMDSVNAQGQGHFLQFTIEYDPAETDDDGEGFEILGMLFDVKKVNSYTGKVTA